MGSLGHFAAADLLSDHCKYSHAGSQYPCQLFWIQTAQQCKRNWTSGGEYVVSIPHQMYMFYEIQKNKRLEKELPHCEDNRHCYHSSHGRER